MQSRPLLEGNERCDRLLATVLKSWRLRAAQGQDMTYELMDVLHDLGTIQVDLSKISFSSSSSSITFCQSQLSPSSSL